MGIFLMAKAYLIINVKVTDYEKYLTYRKLAPEIIKFYGGRYLVRTMEATQLEGERFGEIHAIVEFPDRASAEAFYFSEKYQKIIHHRKNNTDSIFVLADGYEPVEA